jgi:tetratricopeptide (TPR) repeat protein
MASPSSKSSDASIANLRVAFAGKLAGMTRRDAQQLVREHGGVAVDDIAAGADLVVTPDDFTPSSVTALLGDAERKALAENRLLVLSETQFWRRLGLIGQDVHLRAAYTPQMLAELLGVPVATVRHWHRRGLLTAQRHVGRLPYFDFAQVATARQLAILATAGVSQRKIEKQFTALMRSQPGADSNAVDLPAIVAHGRRLLIRQGAGLIEAGGQQQFDFDTIDTGANAGPAGTQSDAILPLVPPAEPKPATAAELVEMAERLEEDAQLSLAAELYRAALASGGPSAEICFALAELLYRAGDLGASRERYYMAIELDENYVEARANLGCVLAEQGELELAASAFEGALLFHGDFPDAHYHLARVLDDLGRREEAASHWQAFLELAPDSPWATIAKQRLE